MVLSIIIIIHVHTLQTDLRGHIQCTLCKYPPLVLSISLPPSQERQLQVTCTSMSVPTPLKELGKHRVVDMSLGPTHSTVLAELGRVSHIHTYSPHTCRNSLSIFKTSKSQHMSKLSCMPNISLKYHFGQNNK